METAEEGGEGRAGDVYRDVYKKVTPACTGNSLLADCG